MKRHSASTLTGAFFILLSACRLFHMSPLAIIAWSPIEKYLADAGSIEIWVEFSSPVEPTSIEQAFSLTEDDVLLYGDFLWEGQRLRFLPAKALRDGRTYVVTISTAAEDKWGNSLKSDFIYRFDTGTDFTRPEIKAINPVANAVLDNLYYPISITFSEKVKKESVYASFSLTPAVKGGFSWTNDDTTCTFTPMESYSWGTEYKIELSETLSDLEGNTLEKEYTGYFTIGNDRTPPEINFIGNSEATFSLVEYDPARGQYTVNSNWEACYDFRLRFSEPLMPDTLENLLVFEPDLPYAITWQDVRYLAEAVLKPAAPPVYGTIYALRIKAGLKDVKGNPSSQERIYRFSVNGPRSKPLKITKVTFLTDPAANTINTLDSFGPLDLSSYLNLKRGFFDIYISAASDIDLSLISFMEAFSITATNNCSLFDVVSLEYKSYTPPQPDPVPDTVQGVTVVRAYLDIDNDDTRSGVVTLSLSKDLKDASGNTIEADWQFIVRDTN
ncbi:MAG: Ig-like domain-containing protein [Spirochaetota bacterium]